MMGGMDDALLARLADTILGNLVREYPCQLAHVMHADADARPPRDLTPVFWGCYDWHSSVHSTWALVRMRPRVDAATRARIDARLDERLTRANVDGELAYVTPRPSFERPYGLAWLLVLAAELRAGDADPRTDAWAGALAPLEALAQARLLAWAERLPAPIRTGEHGQSAFALRLALDHARATGDAAAAAALAAAAARLHDDDADLPLALEPGAYDFVSPTLGAAWLIAAVRAPDDLAAWLDRAAPALGRGARLTPPPATSPAERADGKLVHRDGLALSRAWMLAELAAALPPDDDRRAALAADAAAHGAAGLAALEGMTYAGSHWLPSFALRWLTSPARGA